MIAQALRSLTAQPAVRDTESGTDACRRSGGDVMNHKVDEFIASEKKWREEFIALRKIALDAGLIEELKWGVPCYTDGKKNIVLIHGFKEYCAILFVNGALLKDGKGILLQQTENTQSSRQIRFTSVEEVVKL
jgi:uncharacterized protein YdeI (YjbR/CyaY-like superfamily)